MSTQNETGNNDDARGFASLSSLLTVNDELDKTDDTPVDPRAGSGHLHGRAQISTVAPVPASAPSLPAASVSKPPASSSTQGPPAKPSNARHYAMLLLIPVGILLVILMANTKPSSMTPTAEQAPVYVDSTPAQPTIEMPTDAPATNANLVVGTPPPVGNNLVLDESQIRYCLAQSIRLEGAQELAGFDTQDKITLFNSLIADYNSRCGAYRYHRGVREQAVAAVEPYRSSLRLEGLRIISEFGQEPPDRSDAQTQETTSTGQVNDGVAPHSRGLFGDVDTSQAKGFLEQPSAPKQQVPNTRLDALDDECEAANAQDGEEAYQACLAQNRSGQSSQARSPESAVHLSSTERRSLESACSTEQDLHGAAAYKACVQMQKAAFAQGPQRPNLSTLSSVERRSIESACAMDKDLHGPAAYNTCLRNLLDAWALAPRRPDLSTLSAVEHQSIESACAMDKDLHGPAAYNTCLHNLLDAWTRAPRRPDLSKLSAVERRSIESACSMEKDLHGPAAYNTCLTQQLSQL